MTAEQPVGATVHFGAITKEETASCRKPAATKLCSFMLAFSSGFAIRPPATGILTLRAGKGAMAPRLLDVGYRIAATDCVADDIQMHDRPKSARLRLPSKVLDRLSAIPVAARVAILCCAGQEGEPGLPAACSAVSSATAGVKE